MKTVYQGKNTFVDLYYNDVYGLQKIIEDFKNNIFNQKIKEIND